LQEMEVRKRARLGLGGGNGASCITPRKAKLGSGIAHGGGPVAGSVLTVALRKPMVRD
jgi:hypothetical protein